MNVPMNELINKLINKYILLSVFYVADLIKFRKYVLRMFKLKTLCNINFKIYIQIKGGHFIQ